MNILNLENVSKTYMAKTVLDKVSIGIDDTDKIGVVGANGTGKSTLLAITAGVVEAQMEGAATDFPKLMELEKEKAAVDKEIPAPKPKKYNLTKPRNPSKIGNVD